MAPPAEITLPPPAETTLAPPAEMTLAPPAEMTLAGAITMPDTVRPGIEDRAIGRPAASLMGRPSKPVDDGMPGY
ncbi:hypothetical protein D3C72_931630 [compost metagenome]